MTLAFHETMVGIIASDIVYSAWKVKGEFNFFRIIECFAKKLGNTYKIVWYYTLSEASIISFNCPRFYTSSGVLQTPYLYLCRDMFEILNCREKEALIFCIFLIANLSTGTLKCFEVYNGSTLICR